MTYLTPLVVAQNKTASLYSCELHVRVLCVTVVLFEVRI